ncbi:YkuS family protein [Pelotomaculum schinkii]|uniref:YkuS family protein n=1 Tax=Pelotomaculum schinkii TaxID=78350 RepID=UPI00249F5668|nr:MULTISPECIES: YkuS family protein [Pelotomaculum]
MAVEDGLSNIKNALERVGYKVVSPDTGGKIDATIVTGMDDNMMGMQDIKERSIVLEAAGKTEDQIIDELRNRL